MILPRTSSLTDCYQCFYRRIDTNTYIGIKNFDTGSKSATAFFLEKVKIIESSITFGPKPIKWDTAIKKWQL